MTTALSALALDQLKPTEATMKPCKQYLDYAALQEEAILTYKASNMVLAIHSDTVYLFKAKMRSSIEGGIYFYQ